MRSHHLSFGHQACATETVALGRVRCNGGSCSDSPLRMWDAAALWFPYAGAYRCHGEEVVVADANQVLLTRPQVAYRTTHFVDDADATLWVSFSEPAWNELRWEAGPHGGFGKSEARPSGEPLRRQVLRAVSAISPMPHATPEGAQSQSIQGQGLRPEGLQLESPQLESPQLESLQLECMALSLARAALSGSSKQDTLSRRRRVLVESTKEFLGANVHRSLSLAQIGEAVGASPVYLTQLFKRAQGVPVYRYHGRLRLSASLRLLEQGMPVGDVAMCLGYASHSHFCDAFRSAFGAAPGSFAPRGKRAPLRVDH